MCTGCGHVKGFDDLPPNATPDILAMDGYPSYYPSKRLERSSPRPLSRAGIWIISTTSALVWLGISWSLLPLGWKIAILPTLVFVWCASYFKRRQAMDVILLNWSRLRRRHR